MMRLKMLQVRKDLYMDNPLQAKGAARGKGLSLQRNSERSSTVQVALPRSALSGVSLYPELRLRLARGYPYLTPAAFTVATFQYFSINSPFYIELTSDRAFSKAFLK